MKMFCQVQETKYDVVLNDEDNNFMDAWLDSPSSDPRVRQLLIDYVASVCSITLKKLLYQCYQQRLASCSQHRCTLLMSTTIVYGCSLSILFQSLLTTINKLVSSTIAVFCFNNIVTTIVLCRTTIDRTIFMNIINLTSVVRLS